MSGFEAALTCEQAQRLIHGLLDGDLMDVERRLGLDRHLAGCSRCRETLAELETIQSGLRALPPAPLPDAALEQVWEATVRRRVARRGLDWRFVAAAASVLLFVFVGVRQWTVESPVADPVVAQRSFTDEEVEQAAREARLVLELASGALRRTERTVKRELLFEGVSPALRRIPLRWGDATPSGEKGKDRS